RKRAKVDPGSGGFSDRQTFGTAVVMSAGHACRPRDQHRRSRSGKQNRPVANCSVILAAVSIVSTTSPRQFELPSANTRVGRATCSQNPKAMRQTPIVTRHRRRRSNAPPLGTRRRQKRLPPSVLDFRLSVRLLAKGSWGFLVTWREKYTPRLSR